MTFARIFLLGTISILSACGGGSSGPPPTYGELVDQFQAIDAKFDRGNVDAISDPGFLPNSGSVTYNGVFGVNLPGEIEEKSLIGDLALNVNFGNDQLSGSVRDFVDEEEVYYSGTLQITDGLISRDAVVEDQYTFNADISGNLEADSGGTTSFDGVLVGDFYGDNEEFVAGAFEGDVTTPDGTTNFTGRDTYFVGER